MSDRPSELLIEWANTLTDPLIPVHVQHGIETELRRLGRERPDDIGRWGSLMVTEVVTTLPMADPWRSVEGSIVFDGASLHTHTRRETTQARTLGGREFGTFEDGLDIYPLTNKNLLIDPFLAPLAQPLTRHQAVFFAFASARRGYEAMQILGPDDPVALFAMPLRWALWRRRCYAGFVDLYGLELAISLAASVMEGPHSAIPLPHDSEPFTDADYTALTSP